MEKIGGFDLKIPLNPPFSKGENTPLSFRLPLSRGDNNC